MKTPLLLLLSLTACFATAQWEDVKKVGNGGETYCSTDGEGTVYISSHLPTQAMVSKDWGATFPSHFTFPHALGDMVVVARPGGKAVVSYMYGFETKGMSTWNTTDFGANWKEGKGIPGRPLDREWPTVNEKTNTVTMIYSDGYIGGPKSKGVFVSESKDEGLTWKEISRVDNEPEGNYAVDPHLVSSSDGKLYAFWNVSKDYVTVESFHGAVSEDGGKTWSHHTTFANVPHDVDGKKIDNDERWMLGGLAATGENEVMVFFVNYVPVEVYGEKKACLISHVRYSHDAGKTWSEPKTILNPRELKKAATRYYDQRTSGDNFPDYIQCLTWGCFDGNGKPHFMFFDDRDGQAKLGEKDFNRWHLRHAWSGKLGDECVDSERVSKVFTCKRPPLDFICCCADKKYIYATWTETPKAPGGYDFSGEFYFGRKKLD